MVFILISSVFCHFSSNYAKIDFHFFQDEENGTQYNMSNSATLDNRGTLSNTEISSRQNEFFINSPKVYIDTDQDNRSSLLKSMLTCPMSSIGSPNLGTFNDELPSKQKDSSEIRKMLSEPPKSGSPLNNSLFSSTGPPKSGLQFNTPVFTSSSRLRSSSFASPMSSSLPLSATSSLSSPASALLRSLGAIQRSHVNTTIHSSLSLNSTKKSDPQPVIKTKSVDNQKMNFTKFSSKGNNVDKDSKKTQKTAKSRKGNTLQDGRSAAIVDDDNDGDDTDSKAKAIEQAVNNFSQFLHTTMSKHDFSAEQMKTILESAVKSASKVITDTAKKTNVSENLRASATNFIENAIGNVIRTETVRKQTKKASSKSFTKIKGFKKASCSSGEIGTNLSSDTRDVKVKRKQDKSKSQKKKKQSPVDKASGHELLDKVETESSLEAQVPRTESGYDDAEDMSRETIVIKREAEDSEGEFSVAPKKFKISEMIDDTIREGLAGTSDPLGSPLNASVEPITSPYSHNVNETLELTNTPYSNDDDEKVEPVTSPYTNKAETSEPVIGPYSNNIGIIETATSPYSNRTETFEPVSSPYSNTANETYAGKDVDEESCSSKELEMSSLCNDMGKRNEDVSESKNNKVSVSERKDVVIDTQEHTNLNTREQCEALIPETVDFRQIVIKTEPGCEIEEPVLRKETDNFDKNSSELNKTESNEKAVDEFIRKEIEKGLKGPMGTLSHQVDSWSQLQDSGGKPATPVIYKCNTCGQEFEHKGTLKVHQRGHNFKNKSFQCSICGKCVTDSSYLKIHMRTHQMETDVVKTESFECKFCNLQFTNFENFQIHIRMHSGEKLYQCDVCETGFTRKSQLVIHARIHSGQKPFSCHVCGMNFRQNGGLKLHLLTHTDDKPQKCPFCTASFSRKAHLDKHIRYHSGARPFVCSICGKAFIDKELLKQHSKNVHVGGKPGKRGVYKPRSEPEMDKLGPNWKGFFLPKDNLEDSPSPCYPCGVCGETFGVVSTLVEHLETHNDTSSYNISASNSNSNEHLIGGQQNPGVSGLDSLSIEKSFKCPFCEESFDLPGPRIRHIHQSHPFKNPIVGMDSTDSDYLMKLHLIEGRTVEDLYGSNSLENGNNLSLDLSTEVQQDTNKSCSDLNLATSYSKPESYKVVKIERDDDQPLAGNHVTGSVQGKDVKKYPCPYCERIYQRQSSRTRHINETHRSIKERQQMFIDSVVERQFSS